MFTIIGGDGKEYGPVTADQIRAWIAAGRANLDTKAKAVGSEDWRRLGDYAEFTGAVGLPPVATGQVVATSAAEPGASMPVGELAGRGARLGARVIDWVIAFIGILPGAALLGNEFVKIIMAAAQGQQPNIEELDLERLGVGGLVFGAGWLIVLVIQVILLSVRGQSIGKMIVGLRIVRIADGTQAGFLNAWLMREALITVIGVFLAFIPFLGAILQPGFHLTDWCMIFREDQRCVHDLIAGTQVVKK